MLQKWTPISAMSAVVLPDLSTILSFKGNFSTTDKLQKKNSCRQLTKMETDRFGSREITADDETKIDEEGK